MIVLNNSSTDSLLSSFSSCSMLDEVAGEFGAKTVQLSGACSIEISNVPIRFAVVIISSLSRPVRGRNTSFEVELSIVARFAIV